jgi:hypothetical protein
MPQVRWSWIIPGKGRRQRSGSPALFGVSLHRAMFVVQFGVATAAMAVRQRTETRLGLIKVRKAYCDLRRSNCGRILKRYACLAGPTAEPRHPVAATAKVEKASRILKVRDAAFMRSTRRGIGRQVALANSWRLILVRRFLTFAAAPNDAQTAIGFDVSELDGSHVGNALLP